MPNRNTQKSANLLLAGASGVMLASWAKGGSVPLVILGLLLFGIAMFQYLRFFGLIK